MIPLWTTTSRPEQSVWGWALKVVGRPWVAQRLFAQLGLEVAELADFAPELQLAVADHGDAGGIVAPVLQPLEAFDQDLTRLETSQVADDSTHAGRSLLSEKPVAVKALEGRASHPGPLIPLTLPSSPRGEGSRKPGIQSGHA